MRLYGYKRPPCDRNGVSLHKQMRDFRQQFYDRFFEFIGFLDVFRDFTQIISDFSDFLCRFIMIFGGFLDADTALGGECQKSGFVFRESGITV